MSEFPLDPQLAKALIASCEFDCVEEMVSLAAMLTGTGQGAAALPLGSWVCWGTHGDLPSVPSPASPCFVSPSTHLEEAVTLRRRALLHPHGDHFTLINIFNAFQQRECGRAGLWGLCAPHPPQHVPHPSAGPTAPLCVPQALMCPLLLLGPSTAAIFMTPSGCPSWLQGVPAPARGMCSLHGPCPHCIEGTWPMASAVPGYTVHEPPARAPASCGVCAHPALCPRCDPALSPRCDPALCLQTTGTRAGAASTG